jgi:hypothetical protein
MDGMFGPVARHPGRAPTQLRHKRPKPSKRDPRRWFLTSPEFHQDNLMDRGSRGGPPRRLYSSIPVRFPGIGLEMGLRSSRVTSLPHRVKLQPRDRFPPLGRWAI